jgi:hypothetical protein
MPLTSPFAAEAGIDRSKNHLLQRLAQALSLYERLPDPAPAELRGRVLHTICVLAGTYLTSKPPQGLSTKNGARWEGMRRLLEQVGSEAARHKLRLLAGPADYRSINQNNESYWLELLDKQHRPGFVLAPLFERWLNDPLCEFSKLSFWAFIDLERGARAHECVVCEDYGWGVHYEEDKSRRARHQVTFDIAGRLVDHDGHPLHTEGLSTHASGAGWAIFVQAATGEIYVGSHDIGKFHHSSFLAGMPVRAAGELVADRGVLKALSGKSGHYQPTPSQILAFARSLPNANPGAVVQPNPKLVKPVFHYLGHYCRDPAGAPALDTLSVGASLPPWALGSKVMDRLMAI